MHAMSNTGKHPTLKMLQEANKASTKLKSKQAALKFPNLGNPKYMKVLADPDATDASLEGWYGYLVPISWIDIRVRQ